MDCGYYTPPAPRRQQEAQKYEREGNVALANGRALKARADFKVADALATKTKEVPMAVAGSLGRVLRNWKVDLLVDGQPKVTTVQSYWSPSWGEDTENNTAKMIQDVAVVEYSRENKVKDVRAVSAVVT